MDVAGFAFPTLAVRRRRREGSRRAPSGVGRVMRLVAGLSSARILEWTARGGFAARGLVYLMLGALALMAALELRDAPLGARGALAAFGRWPLGPVWLYTLGLGLFAFAAWRLAQAVLDTEGEGRSVTGIVRRAGRGISGLLHGALGYSALDLGDNVGAFRPGYLGHDAFERVLATPFGSGVLLAVGALVAAAALGNAAKALPRRLDGELGCPEGIRRWAVPVGRAGYLARALVLALIGTFSIEAALGPGALHVVTLGEVLRSLEAWPFGSLALAGTALGLFAFGAYGLVEARYYRAAAPRRPA